MRTTLLLGGLAALLALPALAQPAAIGAQRDADQQRQIQQGLRNGSLSTGEAARLERGAARIDRMEAGAERSGGISAREAARIDRAQDAEGRRITRATANDVTGNPDSRSSRRFAADVGRNARQQQRIADGVREGQLTNREAAGLERREAAREGREYRAGRDGQVGPREQRGIQREARRDSRAIRRQRHDGPGRR